MRKLFIFAIIASASVTFVHSQSHRALDSFNKGVSSSRSGDMETALSRFSEVDALIEREGAPDRFVALTHYNLGVTYYRQRRLAEAIDHLDRALKASNQMHPRAHYVIGLIRFELNDLAGAEKSLRRSIALSAEDAEAWYDLAFVHLAANDHKAAKEAFSKAAKLNCSGAAASLNNLGVLLAREGKFIDAAIEFEKATATDRTGIAAANLEKCRRFMDNSSVASAAELRFVERRSA